MPVVPIATNLLHLRQLIQANSRTEAGILATGIVCEVSSRRGLLTLKDDSGAELLQMGSLPDHLHAGQVVRLQAEVCEVNPRRTGIGLWRLPLVANDDLNYQTGKSASFELAAGRHPIRVEWFNGPGPGWLQMDYEGEGVGP